MQIHKDYRVNLVADLLENLKNYKHHTKPVELAEEVVKLMDKIQGQEYANKLDYQKKDLNSFLGIKNV